jgi:hypothetical protein
MAHTPASPGPARRHQHLTILSDMQIGAAGMPTFESPVRPTLWPVMNDERPAVQLCSP